MTGGLRGDPAPVRRRIVRNLLASAAGGPTPAEIALLRCEALLPELAGGHGESVAEAIISSLRADRAEFTSRASCSRGRLPAWRGCPVPLSESFCDVRLAQIEASRRNPAAAEVALRRSVATLRELGEAEELARTARDMSARGEIEGEVRWRIALSLPLALARRDDPAAERLAREELGLSEPTDMLELRADAEEALDLALERAGRRRASCPARSAFAPPREAR